MGLYPHTYVGCYIQYKHRQLEVGDQVITYETENGEVFKEHVNFSPVTGDKVHKKVLDITKTETLDNFYSINEKLSENYEDDYYQAPEYICPKDHTVLLSNKNEKFGFNISSNEIKDIDFYTELAIDEFADKHKVFINDLKKHVDNVVVKLGVVNYES